MDFFEAQDRARRRTHVLVGLFAAAVIGIVIAVYVVVVVAGGVSMGMAIGFDPGLFGIVALGTGMVIGLGSAFRTAQLRKGGPAVAELLGGRPVAVDTVDPGERRLVNVVEEMAVASGTPVPAIYVLDGEDAINAFAAGYGIHDAAVAVTRGTLDRLNRDELQGVIAHEFSHILNGDMRLNIRLVGLLFGILLLAIAGRGLLRGGMMSRRSRDNRAALLGLALVALGYIGVFFGKLIKAAVSRQREYLADSAAVQFTRNPYGISGALRKIGAHHSGSRIRNHHAEELSHLFFADGLTGALARATSTHPPLEERIRRIDPSWDGRFEPIEAGSGDRLERERATSSGTAGTSSRRSREGGSLTADTPAGGLLGAAALMASVGSPAAEHVAYARRLIRDIPQPLRDAAHEPEAARALLLALVAGRAPGDSREAVRGDREGGEATFAGYEALVPLVGDLPPEARLPLLDLALPALKGLSLNEAADFRKAVERAARFDGAIRPFDFALIHVLWRHLPGGRDAGERSRGGGLELTALVRETEVVLSAMARAGARDEQEASAAFSKGAARLFPAVDPVFRSAEQVGLPQVDGALERLERASLQARRELLEACAAVVVADQEVQVEEAEILRAIAECLDLPLPPILPSSRRNRALEP